MMVRNADATVVLSHADMPEHVCCRFKKNAMNHGGSTTGEAGTIPTATVPTSVIIVGLLCACWRSPAPRSTCGTGKDFARLQEAEARWGSVGEAPRSRCFT